MGAFCAARTAGSGSEGELGMDAVTTLRPVAELDDPPVSRWWLRTLLIVMAAGFAALITVTALAYRNAPPIPARVVDPAGATLFTGDDVRDGQAVFLRHGLMSNGSIWGHGAYLGPDYSADALHRIALATADSVAQARYGRPYGALDSVARAGVDGEVGAILKANRYDAASGTLTLAPGAAEAFRAEPAHWRAYFHDPAKDGGLAADLITDPQELRQFSAFVTWAAWASVAQRPGRTASYTGNFPYDPLAGNRPTGEAVLWSGLSLIALLGGVGGVLAAFGRFEFLGWISERAHVHPHLVAGEASAGQRALMKFFLVVALLLLMQTLVGGATAHYRAEPGNFYGLHLEKIFPSNLMRTWHLQTAIFWIATAYVGAALFIARSLRADEPKRLVLWINVLFAAFAVVIGGSLLGEWAGLSGLLGRFWFLLGDQGWEYLELGRAWQYLLAAGLLGWFALLVALARPSQVLEPHARPLARLFLFASLAIPVFYLPALFFGAKTNYTVVDTWRFWIIHLWVEGFFEFFATTIVAVVFYQMGLTARNTALRVIYMDGILFFAGGLLGTGHHWYFTGQTSLNLALSATFSALEVVPLTLLTLDAWRFVQTTRGGTCAHCGERIELPHRWTFYFLMAVGFWNFVGAGVLGFLINLPIVSYYEVGTSLTPNHGHASMMGVFGMLAVALSVFAVRQASSSAAWRRIEPWVRISFFGLNIGLAMMLALSLFPSGVLQVWDVTQHGYWHARSLAFTGGGEARLLEWMRLPGDAVFILFGAIPLVVATGMAWLGTFRGAARAPHAGARANLAG
jgi:nitric oxide reductase subunit B